jgi:phytoene desaturase
MPHIAIVGAGPGGLAAGMILQHRGYDVTIYEAHDHVGGRSQSLHLGDYRFDVGPTFLMYLEPLKRVFEEAGYDLEKEVSLIPLDPLYRLVFPDHTFEMTADADTNAAIFDDLHAGAGKAYHKWRRLQARKLKALSPLLLRPFHSPLDFVRWDTLKALPAVDFTSSIYSALKRLDDTPEFIHALSFQAKYLGMSSKTAPSAFTFLSYLEHALGLYHIEGGIHQLHETMARLFVQSGGTLRTGTPVAKVKTTGRVATGLHLQNGEEIDAEAVILNADFGYAATHLFDDGLLKKYAPDKLSKKDFSVSTLNLYLGLDTTLPFAHHQIVFSKDYDAYLDNIANNEFTDDISFYLHNPSAIDPTMAPAGHSALYILIPVPNLRNPKDWSTYQEHLKTIVFDRIQHELGIDLRPHIQVQTSITPQDWQDTYRVYEGAVFNLSHKLSQMMHRRPHNRFEEVKHTYLVGGGTHPGSGLPTIYQSGLITANYFPSRR